MRIARKKSYGPVPPSKGWRKLEAWCLTPGNTVAAMARFCQVAQPSAFSWRWRDKRPTGEHLQAVCVLTGATVEEWAAEESAPKRRRRGKAA